ncbi:hypothetical protein [Chryseobacterium vrystaatense]|uniref:Uncharacterized protein n=1 Tax=Chryseobacterium vrystaatense TaxID=307480 RepID=A0ABR4UPF0_9FLAO|nr:hypothetical protein [Chryseobacterium vrystaatense]KFF26886.1 hypothetical protein IW16_06310 [Chryseobacterium vrystaatense]
MKDQNKLPPKYSEKMILTLTKDSKSIEDLTNLCGLLKALEKQKDIIITQKIQREVKLQQQTIIYGGDLLGDKKS